MIKTFLLFLGLLSAFSSISDARAHGTEREFGTGINGGSHLLARAVGGGSPAFTLVIIESNSQAMLRAIEEGQAAIVRTRAARLGALLKQLHHRSVQFSSSDHAGAMVAVATIAESIDRVTDAARKPNTPELPIEVNGLLGHVASYARFLQKNSPSNRDSIAHSTISEVH